MSSYQCEAAILYEPLKNEIDFNVSSFPLKIPANQLILPNIKNSDPFAWAEKCVARFQVKTLVLIPGVQFDEYGTRHGKGGGWYDRFISKLPSTWIKIGIADNKQFSSAKLLRNIWDEPVDWVLVFNGCTWTAHEAKIPITIKP